MTNKKDTKEGLTQEKQLVKLFFVLFANKKQLTT